MECFKNFLHFSSIPLTISGAQLRKQVFQKIITCDSGYYLNMWSITFDVFTCDGMMKLTKASKGVNLTVTIR